jgi:hypothetical protein
MKAPNSAKHTEVEVNVRTAPSLISHEIAGGRFMTSAGPFWMANGKFLKGAASFC